MRILSNKFYYIKFKCLTDLGNPAINGSGGLVLGRGPSPGIVDAPNLSTLTANSLLNGGFQSLSSSTSPILSQGAGNINLFLFFRYNKHVMFLYTDYNLYN